jgi:hypothetical protein
MHEALERLAVHEIRVIRREIVAPRPAAPGDFQRRAFADDRSNAEIREPGWRRRGHGDDCGDGQRRQPCSGQPAFRDQQGAADDQVVRHQEEAVVDARQHLSRREQTEQHAVADEPALKQPVKRPHRERQPLREQQLEMRIVVEPERQEGEHHSRNNRRPRAGRQRSHQESGAYT